MWLRTEHPLIAARERGDTRGILLIAGDEPANLRGLVEAASRAKVTLVTAKSSGRGAIRASLESANVLDGIGLDHITRAPRLDAA